MTLLRPPRVSCRVWDRADSNHRYTTSTAIRAQAEALGWIAEGYGPDQVIMCAAQ